ncbi:pyridoxal phosphate-dependent aminotransferase [Streptosporangiaceae bacterium NEAU-GS5]|nr:pyridoxal phosphate-dependent aminotransferase [Streptosporangiaceae bacterium NEAU-GS5]
MNPLLDGVAPPPAAAMGGPVTVDLTVGTPWYGPPRAFRDAMRELVAPGDDLRRHDVYAPPRGADELRTAIAGLYLAEHELALDADRQILVTHGATGAMWTAVLAGSGAGQEILLPDPCYTLYEPIVTVLGRRPLRVPGDPAAGWLLDPADVARAITADTAMLLLNSPVNPTGSMYGPARLRALAEVTAAAGALLVHDEVLDCFARERPHVPAIALADQGVLVVNSLSKRLGVTGWRLGWLAGDARAVSAAARVHPLTTIAVDHAAQLAGAAALTDPGHPAMIRERAAAIAGVGREFLRALSRLPGWPDDLDLPAGGVYAFPDVTGLFPGVTGLFPGVTGLFPGVTGLGMGLPPGPVDVAVARALRERCGVGVLHGSLYGSGGEGHIRISLAAPPDQLREAIRRLEKPW